LTWMGAGGCAGNLLAIRAADDAAPDGKTDLAEFYEWKQKPGTTMTGAWCRAGDGAGRANDL